MATENDIYAAALSDGMPATLSLLIVAQAKHETDNFTSSVFLVCNNAFGYTAVRSSCTGHEMYQNYPSVIDSVHELTGWIKRRLNEGNFPALNTITTPEQYAQLLSDNGYYTDSVDNYAAGIARWFSDNITTIAGVSLLGIAAGLILFFIVFRKELHVHA